MKEKMFGKFVVLSVFILSVLAVSFKIYDIESFPKISDWNYRQIQKIEREAVSKDGNFSFIVFADNKNSITTFNNLIEKVNQEKAAFSIDVGDLVEDGSKGKFRFFINQIKNFRGPFLTAIGNHELREGGRANYYDLFGRFYYSFAFGKSYFIVLDDADERNLDHWQMNWLKSELRKSQQYKYRFVFMHVPLYDPRDNKSKGIIIHHCLQDEAFAQKLNNLFDEYKVTMLFSSHIHSYYRGIWGKTPYIITGGAGAELGGADPKHYFYHYIRVNVSNDGVRYDIVKLKSPEFELIDRWIHDAGIYIYAFFAIHYIDIAIILTVIYLAYYLVVFKKEWLIIDFRREHSKKRKDGGKH